MLTRRSVVALMGGILGASFFPRPSGAQTPRAIPENLDHLILGCRDLDEGIDQVEKLSGYRALPGGSHPGRGTRNALLGLGPDTYLEILAPDPQQNRLVWHTELPNLTEPTLIGWAVRQKDLIAFANQLRERGIPCEGPVPGSRTRADGQAYRWQTVTLTNDRKGNLPFFIEWAVDSPHPASDAAGGCLLADFAAVPPLLPFPPPAGILSTKITPEVTSLRHARIEGRNGVFEFATQPVPGETWVVKEPG